MATLIFSWSWCDHVGCDPLVRTAIASQPSWWNLTLVRHCCEGTPWEYGPSCDSERFTESLGSRWASQNQPGLTCWHWDPMLLVVRDEVLKVPFQLLDYQALPVQRSPHVVACCYAGALRITIQYPPRKHELFVIHDEPPESRLRLSFSLWFSRRCWTHVSHRTWLKQWASEVPPEVVAPGCWTLDLHILDVDFTVDWSMLVIVSMLVMNDSPMVIWRFSFNH